MSLPAGDSRPRSVLIVDNYREAAASLAWLVEMAGHRAAVADTAQAGLAAIARDPPDVIVLELRLPGLDGWEFARRVRAAGCSARLIAVTTCGRPDDVCRARAAGIDRHFLKPADPGTLLAVVTGSDPDLSWSRTGRPEDARLATSAPGG